MIQRLGWVVWIGAKYITVSGAIRHQGGGGVITVMLWAAIIDNQLIGPVMVLAGVKINSAVCCELLSDGLFPWLEDQSLSLRKTIMFIHDNAPSHSAEATKQYQAPLGFKDNNLLIWPPNFSDFNQLKIFGSSLREKYMPMIGNLHRNPFGNCLPIPETELLQSPFRTEFSMASLSRHYRRSLRHYHRSLQRHCRSLLFYRRFLWRLAVAQSAGLRCGDWSNEQLLV